MAEKSWPWLDVSGDRTVTAAMVAQAQSDAGFIGVVGGLTPSKSGTSVNVAPGTAVINGVTYVLDATANLAPPAGARKDYIVLRYTAANRAIALAVLQGTAGAFPALTKTSAVYEIVIASVDNSGGAFTVVDTRGDSTLCGRVKRMEAGTGSATLAAGATSDIAVNFGRAFEVAPVMVVSASAFSSQQYAVAEIKGSGASTTGATVSVINTSGGSKTVYFHWIAIGY